MRARSVSPSRALLVFYKALGEPKPLNLEAYFLLRRKERREDHICFSVQGIFFLLWSSLTSVLEDVLRTGALGSKEYFWHVIVFLQFCPRDFHKHCNREIIESPKFNV